MKNVLTLAVLSPRNFTGNNLRFNLQNRLVQIGKVKSSANADPSSKLSLLSLTSVSRFGICILQLMKLGNEKTFKENGFSVSPFPSHRVFHHVSRASGKKLKFSLAAFE